MNFSDKTEILISRALSPAKPINLYIDDERKYCEAIFKDDELDLAIGKGGMNIKLASQLLDYRIDAFGEIEYELRKKEQNTILSDIPGFPKKATKSLQTNDINTIAEFQSKYEDSLLEMKEITETVLEKIYDSIQSFIETNRASALEEAEDLSNIDLTVETDVKEPVEDKSETLESKTD